MLKIKDNVKLEELIKLGFTDSSLFSNMILSKTIELGGVESNIPVKVEIEDDRTIHIFIDDSDEDFVQWIDNIDILYDLIKLDLVEKVASDMTDYEQIVISAERYAIGRMTYIVDITVNYILNEIEQGKLSDKCLDVIAKDITEAKDLGMDCDKKQWHKLLNKIKNILNWR